MSSDYLSLETPKGLGLPPVAKTPRSLVVGQRSPRLPGTEMRSSSHRQHRSTTFPSWSWGTGAHRVVGFSSECCSSEHPDAYRASPYVPAHHRRTGPWRQTSFTFNFRFENSGWEAPSIDLSFRPDPNDDREGTGHTRHKRHEACCVFFLPATTHVFSLVSRSARSMQHSKTHVHTLTLLLEGCPSRNTQRVPIRKRAAFLIPATTDVLLLVSRLARPVLKLDNIHTH